MQLPSQSDIGFSLPQAPVTTAPRRNLLIVDDEEGPRLSLRIVFKDDYQVLLAENGAKAIDIVQRSHVDAAILDIRLSDITGIDLLKRLKEIDPALEAVMLTAYETPETTRKALQLGACDYINKPFDIPAMRDAVAKAMRRRAFSDEIVANQKTLEQLKSEIRNHAEELESAQARVMIYASILHDINNPLTYISSATELVADQIENCTIASDALADIQNNLGLIHRYAANCGEIAHRYMQFLRQRSQTSATVALKPLLRDLPLLLRSQCRQDLCQVVIDPPQGDAHPRINGIDLIQILVNLIKNSLQNSPPTSQVRLQNRFINNPLNLSAFWDGPQDQFFNTSGFHNTPPFVALTVTDHGCGIPPERLSRIFRPVPTSAPKDKATGLGLAIVQRLVQEAQGALHIHTQIDHGTTITVYLAASAT
jgi:two-component system, sensor histidine kinase and response regulator